MTSNLPDGYDATQDLAIASLQPSYGQVYWSGNTTSEGSVLVGNAIKLDAAATTLSPNTSEWSSPATNRLLFDAGTGTTGQYVCSYSVTMETGNNDRSFEYHLRRNGTTIVPQSLSRGIAQNSTTGQDDTSKTFIFQAVAGEHYELWAVNRGPNTTSLTIRELNVNIRRM